MENETEQVAETTDQAIPSSDFNIYDAPVYQAPEEKPSTDEIKPVEEVKPEPVVQEPVKPESEVVEPVIQEKVVEKIVEKLPEFKDEYSKSLFESLLEGKDSEVYEYLKAKNTDYNTMSDVDVVKRQMKLQNPTWGDKYIDVEFKTKYGNLSQPKDLTQIDPELEPEEYQKAVDYNEALEMKEVLLGQAATDARIALENTKKTIEFPKIAKEEVVSQKPLTQEEVDELNRQWEAKVEAEIPNLSDLKINVNGEEIVYKITDEDKKAKLEYMKDYNGQKMAQDRGWIDAEGNENVLKIAEDLFILENYQKVIASAATQMKTTATKEVLAEIKNIDLKPDPTSPDAPKVDLGQLLYG